MNNMIQYKLLDNINDDLIDNYIKNNQVELENNTLTFDTKYFIKKNLDSYKNNLQNIYSQFDVDFPRTSIYYNNILVTSLDDFEDLKQSNIVYENYNFMNIIMLLCNQSSYATPYYLLCKLYCKDNLALCDDHRNRRINIYCDDYYKNLNIVLEGQFRLIDTTTEVVQSIIHFTISIITNIVKISTWFSSYYSTSEDNIFTPNTIITWNKIMN